MDVNKYFPSVGCLGGRRQRRRRRRRRPSALLLFFIIIILVVFCCLGEIFIIQLGNVGPAPLPCSMEIF